MAEWYIIYKGQRVGPMSKENLMAYKPTPDTKVWCEGMSDWQPIFAIPELMEFINTKSAPAPAPVNPVQPTPGPAAHTPSVGPTPPMPPAGSSSSSGKDKTIAGVLALLLGGWGIQYFYIGKNTAGIISIAITLVSLVLWFLFIGMLISLAWGVILIIQGIKMLMMSQEEFEEKFVNTDKSFPLF